MDVFSHSSIIGYESHLHTQKVRLPLKYPAELEYSNAGERLESKYFGFSELSDISAQTGSFFSVVQVGVSNDLRTVRLVPLVVDEATSLGVQLQLIEITLPHPLISKDTFTYQFVPSTEGEPYILIDVLDQNYLMISLKIELSDFLIGNAKNRLVLDNFSDWVNISVPYSFELRSPPFLIKQLDLQNLVVSMKDGGLLHFKRSSPLSTFDIYNFSDIVPLMSFNFLGGLFSKQKSADFLVDGISSSCVVDLAQISDTQFVTLSVNKVLKVWDLQTHKQEHDQIELSDLENSSDWLTTLPNKYLQIYDAKNGKRLSILLPNQAVSTEGVARFGYEFVSFEIQYGASGAILQTKSSLELNDDVLKKEFQSSPAESHVFKVQDFSISEQDGDLNYAVLWKSHTYSVTVCYQQSQSTLNLITLKKSMPKSTPTILTEYNTHIEPEAYLNSLFNSGLYDEPIIRAALDVFLKSCELPNDLSTDHSLRQRVSQAIHDASREQGVTDGSFWFKFALICVQFRKTGSEALSILQYQGRLISSQANGIEILKEPHRYETFFHDDSELAKLLKKVSITFSTQTFRGLFHDILKIDGKIDASKALNLATFHFSDKIPESQVSEFTEKLASIENVLDELQKLTGTIDHHMKSASDSHFAGQGSGLLAKLAAVDTFENIRKSHESILISIFVLLLLCEVNDQVLDFLNIILNRFRIYSLMKQTFGMCFSSSGATSGLEKDSVCLLENSIFWNVCVEKNPRLLSNLSGKKWNMAFDFYTNDILLSRQDEYVLDIVLELINRNEGEIIIEKFASKLDISNPINAFLLGLVYLINARIDEFRDIFSKYSTFENVLKDEKVVTRLISSLDKNPVIHDFLKSIFKQTAPGKLRKSNYYHSLSQLMKSFCGSKKNGSSYLVRSLEFEKEAIDILQDSADQKESLSEKHSKMQLMTLYLRNYFCDAVDIEDFDEAIDSLSQLQTMASKTEFRNYMTRLVKSIFAHNNTKRLFGSEFFSRNYLLVDSIILQLANEDLILSNALKCYELLYSWRLFGASWSKKTLGDKRGAVEGLYIFVTRFKEEFESLATNSGDVEDFKQFKLKILELYKVILNTLKTFDDEKDCWIRRRSHSGERLNVVNINELNVEYYQWLKELEHDFNE